MRAYNSTVRSFLEWSVRHGHADYIDLADEAAVVRRSYPKTFGKVQAKHAARRLTYDEAYGAFIDACKDGTWKGSRDQLACRIGLLGIRVAEVTALQWGDLQPDGRFEWIGKGRKPRVVRAGTTLLALLDRWRRHYEQQLGRPIQPDDPILVGDLSGSQSNSLDWHKPMRPDRYRRMLEKRGRLAKLGHVAPHDLRRTAAKLLHTAGFPLQDIQQVLGHARPETTAQYLDALDTDAIDRAATVLD